MLYVTPRARSELHVLLLRALREQPEATVLGQAIRLIAGSGADERSSLSVALSAVRPSDAVLEYEGRAVLIVDASTSHLLETLTLDVVETPEGTRLELR